MNNSLRVPNDIIISRLKVDITVYVIIYTNGTRFVTVRVILVCKHDFTVKAEL